MKMKQIQKWVPGISRATAYPPPMGGDRFGRPDTCPIADDLHAVELRHEDSTRWYGFADAKIDSHLRMRVTLAPGQEHFEEVMAWQTPPPESESTAAVFSSSDFLDGFLRGAARAFFVDAYIAWCEDEERTKVELQTLPMPFAREDWNDFAPSTPLAAYAYAGAFRERLEAANKRSLYEIAEAAEKADGGALDPEEFGRVLAMQSLGHGVSWFDSHAEFKLKVPHFDSGGFAPEAFKP